MKNRTIKTSSAAIATRGINEAHAIKLMKQRARYALQRDRSKYFASTSLGSIPAVGFYSDGGHRTAGTINADLLTLKLASDTGNTREYVAAWCRLNNLKEC